MSRTPHWALPTTALAVLAAAASLIGCSARNYDFHRSTATGPSSVATSNHVDPITEPRAARLAADLDQLTAVHPDDEVLYNLKVFPLLHSELHVFAEDDDADSPAAYIEADVASCLPLFAFVHGEFREYDADQQLLAEHAFDSSLWGMFRTHRETVVTDAGPEDTTRKTYFWLFTH